MKDFKHNSSTISRSLFLDALRGFTIVLMILFHLSYDLDHFGFIDVDIINHPFWYFFPRLIVFLFLFSTGMALKLAHKDGIKWKPFAQRLLLICFWALVISVLTYYFYPDKWIYFGTLHAIAVVSVFSLPFLNRPWESFILALALFLPSMIADITLPWIELPHSSLDYISPFPWLGASLLGIFAAHKELNLWSIPNNKLIKSLNYLGVHSLFIYLIHQPILFGILALVSKVIRS